MKAFRVALLLLLASSFLSISALAQQEEKQAPTRLALLVDSASGLRPSFQSVPNRVWYGSFRRLADWKAPADFLPVQAVNIEAKMEGEHVRVNVFIEQGKEFFEKHASLGSYLMREGERRTLYAMTAFGLAPYEVAIVRVEPRSATLPAVKSNAPSIEVQSVEPVEATFPTFKLSLRNGSTKNVSALFIEMFVNGQRRVSAMPHNADGAPLIPAGEVYEYKRQMNNDAELAGASYVPEVPVNQSLVIEAVVFDDGSYEGDEMMAARFRAFALGRRTQLQRLIAHFQEALDSPEPDAKTVLNNLRQQTSALNTEVAVPVFGKLVNGLQGGVDVSQLKTNIQVVMFELKKDTLRQIDEFAQKQGEALDREALRNWLSTMRDKFQKSSGCLKKF